MKRIKPVISILLMILILGLTGCQSGTVERTQHLTDGVFTDKYMGSVKGITSTDYEGYWWAEKVLWFEMSGKDQGYRGIIYIDETEAKRLLREYDDWGAIDTPLPVMKEVDTAAVGSDEWYHSDKFTSEISKMLQIKDLRFNGVNAIVFDVHTL